MLNSSLPREENVEADEATVFVVEDDPNVRHSLRWLVESCGLRVQTHASAEDFLEAYSPEQSGCLLLDLRMPGMSGEDLQHSLTARQFSIPVIVVTGHGDVDSAVRAMKGGAVDFIEKPYEKAVLLDCIHRAMELDRATREQEANLVDVEARLALLTPREREVMDLVVVGMGNKQVAHRFGISVKTIEIHRSRLMKKLKAKTAVDLARIYLTAQRDRKELSSPLGETPIEKAPIDNRSN